MYALRSPTSTTVPSGAQQEKIIAVQQEKIISDGKRRSNVAPPSGKFARYVEAVENIHGLRSQW